MPVLRPLELPSLVEELSSDVVWAGGGGGL